MKKIGFVTPWYGEAIRGGAETEARELARHLHKAGMQTEILTTCVREFASDWNRNFHRPGTEIIQDIPVRRFRIRKRNVRAFDSVNAKLLKNMPVSPAEEEIFIREMIHSPDLCSYLSAHQQEYTAFVCIPYMFGTTYDCVKLCPEKSLLIPCFHDEAYFHMQIYRDAYARARGMFFNSEPEKRLAEKYYHLPQMQTIGIGMDTNIKTSPDDFRKKFRIPERFILYAGRKDAGKNISLLLRYFEEYQKRNTSDLKLVLIGGGEVLSGENIIDLGYLDTQDKYNACGASEFLCQPSRNESFSLVIMENWLCHRPVLVHDACEVTKHFVREANGGLYFRDYFEFEGCVNYLLTHEEISHIMGENGRTYVQNHFDWRIITEQYRKFFALTERTCRP